MLVLVCRRAALSILGAAVFSCGLVQSAWAANVVVGNCKNLASYPTISQAVSSVPANSTIYICPGTYGEQVLINKSLTLTGVSSIGLAGENAAGADNPVIVSPANGVTAYVSDLAPGADPVYYQIAVVSPVPATPIRVNLSFIAVDGSNNQIAGCGMDLVGIYYQNANGTVNQVVARNQELAADLFGCQDGLAIFAESGYGSGGTSVVTIENSSVHDYDKNGITVDGSGTVATVTGNYVVGIGATPLTAQNGIQVSDGAGGSVKNNTVTDDVYVNPEGGPYYGSSGILLYDSGGTSGSPITISGNTVSNTQLAIVIYGDSNGTADYNTVTSNKVTGTQAAGIYLDDGIDLCSNNNTATLNTVFNSSGSGIHIDSTCTESTGPSGNGTSVMKNIVNEACAGVLLGSGTGSSQSMNTFYNVVQTTQTGDSCPVGPPGAASRGKARLKPLPWRH
jgi:parallel beta-helix repeat protein